jgi:NAD(P)-dependent dehydrogenase (short-subunit alcohol dehydrogenase family)
MQMNELFSVKDKVVHISGGSGGIGRRIAEAFAEAGAKVIVSSRSEVALKATGLCYQVCDITDPAQVEHCVQDIVNQFGRLDVLFNVAGINFRHAAETFPVEKLDDILAVNVRGNYLMARACGQRMVAQRSGKIVNIASLHTFQSLSGVSVYGMSKGAIGSMTRALAVEWAGYNVQVNGIAPGFILTELNRKLWDDPKMRNWVDDRTPAHRLGQTSDLVGAAIFLASAASDFIAGQILSVDGGFSAGSTWPLEVPK